MLIIRVLFFCGLPEQFIVELYHINYPVEATCPKGMCVIIQSRLIQSNPVQSCQRVSEVSLQGARAGGGRVLDRWGHR